MDLYGFDGFVNPWNGLLAVAVIFVLSIAGAIVAYILFLPERMGRNLTGFALMLHKFFNFKLMLSNTLLKIAYLATGCYVTLFGLYMLSVSFLHALLYIVVGNVVARVAYEFMIIIFSIHENLSQMNAKMKNNDDITNKTE